MDVHRISPEDAPVVAALFRRSRAAAMPWLPVLHSPDEDVAYFRGQLTSSSGLGVAVPTADVADSTSALAGFAIVRPGWLDHLYVEPDRRGQGIGGALLDAAREEVTGDLELWVFARNTPALAFYAWHGAIEVARTDGSGNEEREPDLRLLLPDRR